MKKFKIMWYFYFLLLGFCLGNFFNSYMNTNEQNKIKTDKKCGQEFETCPNN